MATVNLGWVKSVHKGTTAPVNLDMLWLDTTVGKFKVYDTVNSIWIELGGSLGFTSADEGAIPFVDSNGDLIVSVDNINYTQDGLYLKGITAQNVLNIEDDADNTLLLLDNTGVLTFGVNELNLLNDLSVQNDLLYFDTINNRIGIGLSTPTATLHAKGNSDSVGSVLKLESLSNNVLEVFNTRDILFGSGSLTANTQVEINPYRAAGTSNFVFRVNAQGTGNYMSFVNANTNTFGGLYISRESAGIGRQAFSVGGNGGVSFVLTSNGSIGINTSTAGTILPAEIYNNGLINSNVAGKNGLYFVTAGSNRGFIFEHLGTGSFNTTQAAFQISKSLTDSSAATDTDKLFEINGTYNFTGGAKGLIGINYNTTITALSGSHYGLLIRPSNTLNGIGHTTNLPTATWHIKGSSDSVGNIFVAENLSNTANLTIANNGASTFNFGSGGKVYIAGAVGSGDTLLEIRRTSSSSGGFIFSSGNAGSQHLSTTNGAFNISTVDNSNITINPGTGSVLLNTSVLNMNAINTGVQLRIGTQASSSLNRWLNIGHHTNHGMILQAAQNGSTPAIDRLSLNPYGGLTYLYGESTGSATDVWVGGGNAGQVNGFRIYRNGPTNGIGFRVGNAVGFGMLITHEDATNTSGYANIQIIQGNNAVFSAGKTNSGTRNNFYGNQYGSIDSYAMMVGVKYDYAVNSTRGITFNATNTSTDANVIQSVHDGFGKPLSLNTYGGNVSIGNILAPTATLHIKGNSDSVGSSFRVENLSNTTYFIANNNGSVEQNVPAGGSNKNYHFWRDGGTNVFTLQSSGGNLGLWFRGLPATSIGVEQNNLVLRGQIASGATQSSIAAISFQNGTTATIASDVYYDFGFFTKTYTATPNANVKILRIRESLAITTSGTGNFTFIENTPTINQTGGTHIIIGYNYNPTLTSILGAHYGILIRPNTLNGFGLGATLPTALLDLEGSTTARASLRIRSGTAPTSPNDGDIWSNGTDLLVRFGGTTYTLVKV